MFLPTSHANYRHDTRGNLKGVYFNNQIRSWYYDAPVEKIPLIMQALKQFHTNCYQQRNLLEIKLKPGGS
jgi:hypothetical protein